MCRSGGLAFLWRWQSETNIISYSPNHIDVEINRENERPWRFTGMYGEPNRNFRFQTWNLLRTLVLRSQLPWCIMGDLNNIRATHEQQGGGVPYPCRLIDGFNQALSDCNLIDIDLQGHPYTWERSRGKHNWMEARLDRCLKNHLLSNLFPHAALHNLEFSSSDNWPIILESTITIAKARKYQFRFENAWLKEPLCIEIIKSQWLSDGSSNIFQKITNFTSTLSDLVRL